MSDFNIKKSELEGLGCFSNRQFKIGDIIVCYVILIEKGIENKYTFPWNRQFNSIVLSELSYCNSSITPNIKILKLDKDNKTKTFIFLKDVVEDEEILLDYKI